MSRSFIKMTERAACKPGDFAKGPLGGGIAAFEEHEHRHAEQSDLSGGLANRVDVFFESIANVNGGVDLASARLGKIMSHILREAGRGKMWLMILPICV